MKDIVRLLKSAGIYLIGNVLSKLAAFLMLPIHTAYLNPAAYGAYDATLAYASFFGSVLYLDIWNGILRFMYDEEQPGDKLRPALAGATLFSVSSTLFCIGMLCLSQVLSLPHVGLLCLYGVMNNLQQAAGSISRGLGQRTRYMAAGIAGAVCSAVSSLLLLRAGLGVPALYISSCLGALVATIIQFSAIRQCPRKDIVLDPSLLRRLFIFSLPLSLNSIAYWFLTAYNRIAISRTLSDYDNGLYAIAGKFGMIVLLVTQCVQLAWQELAFARITASPDMARAYFSRAIALFLCSLVAIAAALLLAVPLVFPYIVDAAYQDALSLVPLYLLAMLFSATCSFLASIFGALKKTNALFINMAIGAVVNVLCLHAFMEPLGAKAAALSMAAGFGVTAIAHALRLQKEGVLSFSFRKK